MQNRLLALMVLMATCLLLAPANGAQPDPAIGLWQVYSDKDGAPNGQVRTYLQNGKLAGVVEQLRPGSPPDKRCTKCSGEQRDKPIKGLVIMWGLDKDNDKWTGGTILDPENGATYRCNVRFVAPDSLEVRGYIGFALFGRTQTWKRLP
jgi:uncharacterized protein (DUF2147 family)